MKKILFTVLLFAFGSVIYANDSLLIQPLDDKKNEAHPSDEINSSGTISHEKKKHLKQSQPQLKIPYGNQE